MSNQPNPPAAASPASSPRDLITVRVLDLDKGPGVQVSMAFEDRTIEAIGLATAAAYAGVEAIIVQFVEGMRKQGNPAGIERFMAGFLSLEEAVRRYPPQQMKEGWNVMGDGERVFFISTPSSGLWSTRARLEERAASIGA